MTEITETPLPGVGVRHDFACGNDQRVGVVSHHSGRRELLVYDRDDPDRVSETVPLSTDEARSLGTLLGGPNIVERLDDLRQQIAGLEIAWLPISPNSGLAGRPLGETQMRTRTGVSIVALLRGDQTIPAPGPDDLMLGDDVAVVVGTDEGIDEATRILGAPTA
ncbi:MAG: cation:proton antiporter regulatory subunit [Ilumatobacter sp.]|nr:cation:proton antiporter regulatory subunit [Ilumatobacter sp.]